MTKIGRDRVPYAQVHRDVVQDARLSVGARMLYVILCSHADAGGASWPGMAKLAREFGCSEMTISRYRAELVKAHLLTVTRRTTGNGRTTSNHYQLHDGYPLIGEGALNPLTDERAGPLTGEGAQDPNTSEGGDPNTAEGVAPSRVRGLRTPSTTWGEGSDEQSRRGARDRCPHNFARDACPYCPGGRLHGLEAV